MSRREGGGLPSAALLVFGESREMPQGPRRVGGRGARDGLGKLEQKLQVSGLQVGRALLRMSSPLSNPLPVAEMFLETSVTRGCFGCGCHPKPEGCPGQPPAEPPTGCPPLTTGQGEAATSEMSFPKCCSYGVVFFFVVVVDIVLIYLFFN